MVNFSCCRRVLLLPMLALTAGCGLGTISTIGSLAELVRSYRQPGEAAQPVQVTAEVQRVDARRQLLQVETPDGRAGGVVYDLATEVVHEQQPYPVTSLGPGDVVELRLQEAQNALYASRIEVVRLAEEDGVAEAAAEPAAAAPAPADTLTQTAPADAAAEPAPDAVVAAEPAPAEAPAAEPPPAADVQPEPAPAEPQAAVQPEARPEAETPATLPTTDVRQVAGEVGAIQHDRGTFELRTDDGRTLTVSLPFNPPAEVLERFQRLRSGDAVRLEAEPLSGVRLELVRFQ